VRRYLPEGEKEREVSELREGREEMMDKGFLIDFGFHTISLKFRQSCVEGREIDRKGRGVRLTVPSPPLVARYLLSGLKTIELVTVPFS